MVPALVFRRPRESGGPGPQAPLLVALGARFLGHDEMGPGIIRQDRTPIGNITE
jgi:hypothetical protein